MPASEHSAHGCRRPEAMLLLKSRLVPSIAIQKIVHDYGLCTRHRRELLSAASLVVGTLERRGRGPCVRGRGYLGSSAVGFLQVCRRPETAVTAPHNDVRPFYRRLDLSVRAMLTDNWREFCGTERHGYELYLDHSGIEHRRTKVRSTKTPRRAFQRHHPRRTLPYQDAGAPLQKCRGAPGRPRHLAESLQHRKAPSRLRKLVPEAFRIDPTMR